MKKIIILIIAVFVQVNVYGGNTETECIELNSNDELIEKLSLTPEMSNLRQLAFLTSFMKRRIVNMKKEGIEITKMAYKDFENVAKVVKENYDQLLEDNLELKKLDVEQQKEVFKAAIQKNSQNDLITLGTCLLQGIEVFECVNGDSNAEKVIYFTCMMVSAAGDIAAVIFTDGFALAALEEIVTAEFEFCEELAFSGSVIYCILDNYRKVICCIIDKFSIDIQVSYVCN